MRYTKEEITHQCLFYFWWNLLYSSLTFYLLLCLLLAHVVYQIKYQMGKRLDLIPKNKDRIMKGTQSFLSFVIVRNSISNKKQMVKSVGDDEVKHCNNHNFRHDF